MQALRDHELDQDRGLVAYVDARKNVGYEATVKILSQPNRPEAIFTSNGLLGTGAFRALRESRLKIPE